MSSAFRKLSDEDRLSGLKYPESTNPIEINIREYVAKCVAGDIHPGDHEDRLENQKHPQRAAAEAAEEFFSSMR